MSKTEEVTQHNIMIKELIEERPELAHFYDVGIILQDYINAFCLKEENEGNPVYSSYVMCLFFIIADRYKAAWSWLQ